MAVAVLAELQAFPRAVLATLALCMLQPEIRVSGTEAWACSSDVELPPAALVDRKGLALDDNTLRGCPSRIPSEWPNTESPVKSLRLFKAWNKEWPEYDRQGVWRSLQAYAEQGGVKIFVGTQITCSQEDDDQDWVWVKELLRMLGPSRIMGVSIGNELDILWTKGSSVDGNCITNLWEGGRLWREFQRRVRDLDGMGLGAVPVTSVFTGAAMGGGPIFMEQPGHALVNSFLTNATAAYKQRFVFTFNFYPYFDPNYVLDANTDNLCSASLAAATCWNDASCSVPATSALARRLAAQLVAASAGGGFTPLLWVGETGWSSPAASTLHTAMAYCAEWSSLETLRTFYTGFLEWTLDGDGSPDHVFYFTARDSMNFDEMEHFGLIDSCMDARCKIKSDSYKGPPPEPDGDVLGWLPKLWLTLGGLIGFAVCLAYCAHCQAPGCIRRLRRKSGNPEDSSADTDTVAAGSLAEEGLAEESKDGSEASSTTMPSSIALGVRPANRA